MKDLRGEVAAEGPPCGAVEGGADVMLVAVKNLTGRKSPRAVSKDSTVLNQSLVRKGPISDKDCRTGADSESDDGTVLGMKISQNWFVF